MHGNAVNQIIAHVSNAVMRPTSLFYCLTPEFWYLKTEFWHLKSEFWYLKSEFWHLKSEFWHLKRVLAFEKSSGI
jgi:hypothetical protein